MNKAIQALLAFFLRVIESPEVSRRCVRDAYFATATSPADLEDKQRIWERASGAWC